jgi:hypothetical protein
MQKNKITLAVEPLEARIAPTAASGNPAGVLYIGPGLVTPGGLVPQDSISGEGIGPESAGQADGNGSLKAVFGGDGNPSDVFGS